MVPRNTTFTSTTTNITVNTTTTTTSTTTTTTSTIATIATATLYDVIPGGCSMVMLSSSPPYLPPPPFHSSHGTERLVPSVSGCLAQQTDKPSERSPLKAFFWRRSKGTSGSFCRKWTRHRYRRRYPCINNTGSGFVTMPNRDRGGGGGGVTADL